MAGKVDGSLIALSHLASPLQEAVARLTSRRDEAVVNTRWWRLRRNHLTSLLLRPG